jgi:hypothetical protein
MQPEMNPRETEEPHRAGPPAYPGTPRWVKVFGITAIVLVLIALLIVLIGVGGPHGPGRHLPSSGGPGTPTPFEGRQ